MSGERQRDRMDACIVRGIFRGGTALLFMLVLSTIRSYMGRRGSGHDMLEGLTVSSSSVRCRAFSFLPLSTAPSTGAAGASNPSCWMDWREKEMYTDNTVSIRTMIAADATVFFDIMLINREKRKADADADADAETEAEALGQDSSNLQQY